MARDMRAKLTIPVILVALVLLSGLAIQSVIGGPDLRIDVGPGLDPSISWSPDVGISSIRVHEGPYKPGEALDRDQVMWWIETTAGNLIQPNINYGTVVSGARTIQQARDLVQGRTYTVYIYQASGSVSSDANIYEATETFIARDSSP